MIRTIFLISDKIALCPELLPLLSKHQSQAPAPPGRLTSLTVSLWVCRRRAEGPSVRKRELAIRWARAAQTCPDAPPVSQPVSTPMPIAEIPRAVINFISVYSPPGDGDCLFNSIMRCFKARTQPLFPPPRRGQSLVALIPSTPSPLPPRPVILGRRARICFHSRPVFRHPNHSVQLQPWAI